MTTKDTPERKDSGTDATAQRINYEYEATAPGTAGIEGSVRAASMREAAMAAKNQATRSVPAQEATVTALRRTDANADGDGDA